jgi:Domain of unknown function (DUF4279)
MRLYDDDFATCTRTYATLRLFSNDIEPTSITAVLNIPPSKTFIKGQPHGQHDHIRKSNGWFLSSEREVNSKDTRRHIDWLLSRISDKSAQLAELRSKGVEVDISCLWESVGQGGPIISAPQMKELARLNIDVWWDVYFDEQGSRKK